MEETGMMSEEEARKMLQQKFDRLNTLPKSIIDRSINDATIANAMYRFAESDQTVEAFLEELVNQLADERNRYHAHIQRYLETGIVRMVV
jgi:hypothetical protein